MILHRSFNGDYTDIQISHRECNGIPGLGVALEIRDSREPDVGASSLHGPPSLAAHTAEVVARRGDMDLHASVEFWLNSQY